MASRSCFGMPVKSTGTRLARPIHAQTGSSKRLQVPALPQRSRSVAAWSQTRTLHSSSAYYGILPPSGDNPSNGGASGNGFEGKAAELSVDEYNQRANIYLDTLVSRLEDMQEKQGGLEVDYSVSALIVHHACREVLTTIQGWCARG